MPLSDLRILRLGLPLALAAPALAQVPISGNLSDATTGPLQSGIVYHATGALFVPAGAHLTVQPGAIVKFVQPGSAMTVTGTLDVQPAPGNPAIFTSIEDDSAGGDTNGNGPSVGTPGHWRGITIAGPGSAVRGAELRYGGFSGLGMISLSNAHALTVTDTLFRDGAGRGLHMGNWAAPVTVTGCTFHNQVIAIDGANVNSLGGFSGNTASGTGLRILRVISGNATQNLTLGPQSGLEGTIVFGTSFTVNTGVTVTLEPGTVLKFQQVNFNCSVNGTLKAVGTASDRIVFTSFRDDSAGGDANGDGPSSGAPGDWAGMAINTNAANTHLEHAELRYAGNLSTDTLRVTTSSSPTLRKLTIRNGANDALVFIGTTGQPLVEGCSFLDNGGGAIEAVPLWMADGLRDNTASGNARNYARVSSGFVDENLVLGPENCMGGALVLQANAIVASGRRLTLQPGTVLKFWPGSNYSLDCPGGLDVPASLTNPVVVTDLRDDVWGGDTNGDGASSMPAPGALWGVRLRSTTDASTVEGLLVRFGGSSTNLTLDALYCDSPLATLRGIRVEHSLANGFELRAASGTPEHLVAWNCAEYGMDLTLGSFNVRKATVLGSGKAGLRATAQFGGQVVNSISWGNAGAAFTGFAAGAVRYCDGDPALAGSNGNILVDPLFTQAALGDLTLQVLSPCVDAGDPASPLDPDGTIADMGAYARDQCVPATYCTPKATSIPGCTPSLTWTGSPSATAGSGFVVSCGQVPGGNVGIFFYGQSGAAALPLQGGLLCVLPPFLRTAPTTSGGTAGACNGTYKIDFNAYVASGIDPTLKLGSRVNIQTWFRDPPHPVAGSGLSGGLQFVICP